MVEGICGVEFIRVVVLVRREEFTKQFTIVVRESSQVEWKTGQSFQTGKRALKLLIKEISTKSSDIQVGEMVLLKVSKNDISITATESWARLYLWNIRTELSTSENMDKKVYENTHVLTKIHLVIISGS